VEANLRPRLITAIIGIPLLIFVVGWGHPWLFAAVFFLICLIALGEYFAMVFPDRMREQLLGVAFGSALSLLFIIPDVSAAEVGFGLWVVMCSSFYVFMTGRLEDKLARLAWTLLGGIYLGYLLPHWVLLFRLPQGRGWVFLVLAVIMVGDTTAYFVGQFFGKKKLAPEISPGKTLEGALGYVAGSVLTGCIGASVWMEHLSWPEAVVLSAVLSIFGQIGDLFESWIKRVFAVKDSSALLPGHGGLLDRLDSLIFPAVFTTAYVRVFHS
jgi:phosphatidate cytidylyltransferase